MPEEQANEEVEENLVLLKGILNFGSVTVSNDG